MRIFSFHDVKIEHTVGVQNKDFFKNAYLMAMAAETLATTKVKIAKIYALVRRNLMIYTVHGKLNIEFCYIFCRICHLGRLSAIIVDVLCIAYYVNLSK